MCRAPLDRRLAAAVLLVLGAIDPARAQPTPRSYAEPTVTSWKPAGCRGVPFTAPAIPSRNAWRNLHGDVLNSDEVGHALAPVIHEAWTAEDATYNVTGPVFDSAGNLYFAPLIPHENVVLVSLEPTAGARRWVIPGTGAPPGASAPLVLRDPDPPGGEIVYLALYDRVIAVRTDGSIVWDVPTGLTSGPDPLAHGVLGTNYLPSLDAVVGLSSDGHLFVVDRRTGAPALNAPYQLPGERTLPGAPLAVPPGIVSAAEALLQARVNVAAGGLQRLVSVLLGNDTKVANMFGVDPWTGRLWVAATAPDAEDGTVDGVSALGALFRLELVPSGAAHDIVAICHRSFAGGSASTPTLNADGSRIYLGDNFGKLLAIRDDCSDAWEVDLGAQIFGSVSVPADRNEIYASTARFIAKVVDEETAGNLVWTATIDPFENLSGNQTNFNLNLVTAAANGLAFQGGAGLVLNNTPLPAAVGVGIVDRETGLVRSFAAGGEETVAVMSVGPDGAMYLGNSPVRRLFANVLGLSPAPIRGGITKFARDRLDLLARDAACAGEARARNGRTIHDQCPASAEADREQILVLIDQAQAAVPGAVTAGDLPRSIGSRVRRRLRRASRLLAAAGAPSRLERGLRRARPWLARACRTLTRREDCARTAYSPVAASTPSSRVSSALMRSRSSAACSNSSRFAASRISRRSSPRRRASSAGSVTPSPSTGSSRTSGTVR